MLQENFIKRITVYVRWAVIDGFPDYRVSSNGMVMYKKRLMKPKISSNDMLFVAVYNKDKTKFKHVKHRYDVHRLVWDCFGSEPHKEGFEIHHLNHNHHDNRIENMKLIPLKEHKEIHRRVRMELTKIKHSLV